MDLQRIRWRDLPLETVNPLMSRRVVHTPAMTIVDIIYKRGALVPLHHHVHEQITTVIQGLVKLEVNGQAVQLGPGESLCVPPNVPHLAEALEDSRATEIFVPARTDWVK